MKIAIPVFHTKISPRFDQTQAFVFVETENARIVAREHLQTGGWSVLQKMQQLLDKGVDTLICGGIDRTSLQYLSARGIRIYSWVTGELEDALTCYLAKRMKPGIILGAHGKMKGRWQFCKGRHHLCNMFQTGYYHQGQGEVNTMPRGDGTGPQGKGPRSGRGGNGCKSGKGGRGQGQGQGRGRGSGQGRQGGPRDAQNGTDDRRRRRDNR